MDYYLITVSQGQRATLERALRKPANRDIFVQAGSGRYADGSTSWEVAVQSPSTAQRIKDVLWTDGISWCSVRPMTAQELKDAL